MKWNISTINIVTQKQIHSKCWAKINTTYLSWISRETFSTYSESHGWKMKRRNCVNTVPFREKRTARLDNRGWLGYCLCGGFNHWDKLLSWVYSARRWRQRSTWPFFWPKFLVTQRKHCSEWLSNWLMRLRNGTYLSNEDDDEAVILFLII